MKLSFKIYKLIFKQPAGTSRGVLNTKETYFLTLENDNNFGIGECNLFKGLSFDDVPDYEEKLEWVCQNIDLGFNELYNQLTLFPSIQFGLEQAFINFNQAEYLYFPSLWTQGKDGILINGLIWMGDLSFMKRQIDQKIEQGYGCIKLKIGIDWEKEHELIKSIRKYFPPELLEIRVDANGGFTFEQAKIVLDDLYKFHVHSIEQPIKVGNYKQMAELCETFPTPIALDEELIGLLDLNEKQQLLKEIKPQYIILKPSLLGGYKKSEEWITLADDLKIGWWITSALESNIGLNAIAQWTYTLHNPMPQGLGTGSLYTNNISVPIKIKGEELYFMG